MRRMEGRRVTTGLLLAGGVLVVLASGCSVSGEVREVGSSPEPTFPQDQRVLRDKLTGVQFGLSGPDDVVKRACSDLAAFVAEVGRQTEAARSKAGITLATQGTLNQANTACLQDPTKAVSLLSTLTGSAP